MTFLLTLFFNIEVNLRSSVLDSPAESLQRQLGLAASTFFSLVLVIQQSTQTRIKIITRLAGSDEWIPVDETPEGMEAADDEMAGVVSTFPEGAAGRRAELIRAACRADPRKSASFCQYVCPQGAFAKGKYDTSNGSLRLSRASKRSSSYTAPTSPIPANQQRGIMLRSSSFT